MTARLDKLITFRRKSEVNTGRGLVPTWADLGRSWAHRSDGAATEGQVADAIEARAGVRYLVRKTPTTLGLRATDVIVDRGLTLQILGIREMPRADLLEISTEARADL